MIRSRCRSALAGLVVLGGLALAGCGAGQIAQTAQARSTVDGVSAQLGTIAIRDAALEYPPGGVYEKGSDARLRMVVVNGGTSSDALTSVTSTVAQDVTIAEGTSATATASAAPAGTSSPTGSATFSPSPTPTGTASGTPTGTAEPPQSSATGSATPSGSASAEASPTPTAAPAGQQSAQVRIPPNGYVSFREDGPRVMLTGLSQQLRPGQNLSVTLTFANAGSVTMTIAVATPEAQLPLAPTVSVEPGGESEG